MAVETTQTKSRGEGPVAVTYLGADGKDDHKRVPDGVKGIVLKARKSGAIKQYDIHSLPENVKNGLVAKALANAQKIYIANHAEGNDDVIKLADQVYSDFVAGKLYTKAEGGAPRGKKFDPTIYVQAAVMAHKAMAGKKMKYKSGQPIQPMSDKDISDLTDKYMSASPKERSEMTRKMKLNSFYEKALKELQARAVKIDAEDGVDALF